MTKIILAERLSAAMTKKPSKPKPVDLEKRRAYHRERAARIRAENLAQRELILSRRTSAL